MTEKPDTPDDDAQPAEEPEFLNRAARRAKGKKGGAQQQRLDGGPNHVDTHGPTHGQRDYGRRRSG
ncbi:MAG TPA: hypothetical protein VGN37_22755 [Actinocatenispora sp.]